MKLRHRHRTEVWAQLVLCETDQRRIQEFFVSTMGLKLRCVVPKMHLTVYHARRLMPGINPIVEPVNVLLPVEETRFMVMAPGGENPRPELEPSKRKIGIRVHRKSSAFGIVQEFRRRLLLFETLAVLGPRRPSTRTRNAFGARCYQPHVALLRAGSNIERDLSVMGKAFRNSVGTLLFDAFIIDVVERSL